MRAGALQAGGHTISWVARFHLICVSARGMVALKALHCGGLRATLAVALAGHGGPITPRVLTCSRRISVRVLDMAASRG